MLTGILLVNGSLSASILNSLFDKNLVKEGTQNLDVEKKFLYLFSFSL